MQHGRCLCGDVTFSITAEMKSPAICHCTQCRRQTGHVWAEAFVAKSGIEFEGELKWYEASPLARRGFCPRCGSFLVWWPHEGDSVAVSLGALDAPTGLRIEKHYYVPDKGDYYDITDGLPQLETE